jgi:hypothetical protein
MHRSTLISLWITVSTLAACTGQPPTRDRGPAGAATVAPPTATSVSVTKSPIAGNSPALPSEPDYASLELPLARRSEEPAAGRVETSGNAFALFTGDYRLDFGPATPPDTILLSRAGSAGALALRPLGGDLSLLQHITEIKALDDPAHPGVRLAGSTDWADFALWLWVYPHNPGLVRYHLELVRLSELPAGSIEPEWTFVEAASGVEVAGGYSSYAEKAAFASPSFYGHAQALDSTLLIWVDVTRLTPLIQATHHSPNGLPVRQGRQFGSNFSSSDLQRLPLNTSLPLYDGYVYLAPGTPEDEAAMFLRYLQQVADIYDLIAHPYDQLPDWQGLARRSLADLQDPDTWVELDNKRYWRAYVADTRLSAEAITQLDVGLGVARYAARYGQSDLTQPILDDFLAALPNFYNPGYGLVQNSGPVSISGDQTRGDTWYELGHALKLAELGLLGYNGAADLARDSQAAWMDFGHEVNYAFPQFYTFRTWKGTGREPDAGGGYALYMLRLSELGCGGPCVQEAESAVRAFPGHGFAFAYETHMTAMSALAAAELADRTGNDDWLAYAYGPIANLLRLSWIYESDYGRLAPAHTFFGLAPTQRAAVITPKEQYEAWIYLSEFLRRAHGRIDPSVEKLVAEFCYHTPITLVGSLPPLLPPGVATEHPAAYQTVQANRLDLYIPLEDMGDGYGEWGAIGQQVYGAGMAPTFAALAYVEVEPGVTVYSGYPVAKIDGLTVTFAGVPGSFAPVAVSGVLSVTDGQGKPVMTQACGAGLCFEAEGGGTYGLQP